MNEIVRFVPRSAIDAKANLAAFVHFVRSRLAPLGLECNQFEDHAWSIEGLGCKGGSTKFVYFAQLGFRANQHYRNNKRTKGVPADVPEALRMRDPFLVFAKAMLNYLHHRERTVSIPQRVSALRYLEAALYELNECTCPSATTPEVLERACNLAIERQIEVAAYDLGIQLALVHGYMVDLALVTSPTRWIPSIRPPQVSRNRVGIKFDQARQKKLPSPLALDALASVFNSATEDEPREVLASSLCALMVCDVPPELSSS